MPEPDTSPQREDDTLRPRDRVFSFRAAQDGDQTTVTGYASVFGSRNSYGEVFVPGAFADTLAGRSDEKPLVMCWLHREPIGRWTDHAEDDHGLRLSGPISDTALGRDASTLVRDGAVTGLSIGFWPRQEVFVPGGEDFTYEGTTYRQDRATFYILKADLAETSLVIAPSDDEARVSEVRSRQLLDRAARALPAIADPGADWDELAWSMALLMGGRGAAAFADELDSSQRHALYQRLADGYARHGKTPPPFTPEPTFRDVPFAHDEREVFHDRYLRKTLDQVVAGANGVSGALSAPTRQRATDARDALTRLIDTDATETPDETDERTEVLAQLREALTDVAQLARPR
jgi:uncharacterized protein